MNSNTAALQTGHHHHHQTSSSTSANSQYHHPSVVTGQNPPKPAVNPNPSVHRYNSLNDNNPWLHQSQVAQQGPTPPLRQHKRPAPHPPPPSISSTTVNQQSKANIHLSVNSTYNQPVHFNSAQTQTTPGLVPSSAGGIHQQHSPKSPNQNFLHQPGSNLMSTSLSSASSSNMVNSHHHLPPSSHQSLSTSLHHTTSSSLSNNNNNNNFDDLNLNGTSSISTASSSHQKKLEMKLNTMP